MKNTDWNKLAKYALLGLLGVVSLFVVVIPAVEVVGTAVGDFLIAYVDKHPVGVLIMIGFCVFVGWMVIESNSCKIEKPKGGRLPKPTDSDYFIALKTVRVALAEVADALGLDAITSRTDMAVDPDERILVWERVWGMKYKAKKKPGTKFDCNFAQRILQAQIRTVLQRDNPSRFSEIWFNNNGSYEPILQVADVDDGDVFVYFYIVTASDVYFRQKKYDEEQKNTIKTDTSADDTDF